jgi:hypothetical protein
VEVPWTSTLPPPTCLGRRGDPLELHLDAAFPLVSLSLVRSPSLPCMLPVKELGRHGRRPLPPFQASPSSDVATLSSASPPMFASRKESSRVVRERRRRPPPPRRRPRPPPSIRRRSASVDLAGTTSAPAVRYWSGRTSPPSSFRAVAPPLQGHRRWPPLTHGRPQAKARPGL